MIYYVGSVFIITPSGERLLPVVWRFQVDSSGAFETMALGVAAVNYGEGVVVEFGTIGVSKHSHA